MWARESLLELLARDMGSEALELLLLWVWWLLDWEVPMSLEDDRLWCSLLAGEVSDRDACVLLLLEVCLL